MTVILNKDGMAIEEGEVTLYDYDPTTGESRGSFQWFMQAGTGLPAHSTMTPPPAAHNGYAPIYSGGAWELVEDYRKCYMFSVTTGEMLPVRKLGPIPDGFTLSAPSSIYDEFINGQWVKNNDKEKQHQAQLNQAIRKQKLQEANMIIDGTQDFIDSGEAPPAIVAMHKAWRNYRARLFLVSLPNPTWPVEPSQDWTDYQEQVEETLGMVQISESVNQEVSQKDDSVNQVADSDEGDSAKEENQNATQKSE